MIFEFFFLNSQQISHLDCVILLKGDKKETAVNISESCKHFSYDMERLYLTDYVKEDVITKEMRLHSKT